MTKNRKPYPPIPPATEGEQEGSPAETRSLLLALMDFCTVEGALIRAPQFVHYIEMARIELEHWRPEPSPRSKDDVH